MKMYIWYCSNTGGQQLLESCETEDTNDSETNCLKLLKWAKDMIPMLDWERDDYEQFCATCTENGIDRYFLANTDNN
jgi:hypothetical protein